MWCRSWQPKVVTSFARKQPPPSSAFPWPRSASGGNRAKGRVQLACATRFFMILKVSSRCDQISQASFRRTIAGATRRRRDPAGGRVRPAALVAAPKLIAIGKSIQANFRLFRVINEARDVPGQWLRRHPPRYMPQVSPERYRSRIGLDPANVTGPGCVRNASWPAWPLGAF
jgi:hypothetical protein